jgi:lipoprotein-releasing system permease protein
MFELSIAKKYLLPKRRQLSVSLIALMSVLVISLVVWLVLIFLSVTEGIERGWLSKLTTLNGPLRITPTQEYFNSYYYRIDAYAQNSGYSTPSIGEKARSLKSDPYDPFNDMELPFRFPKPDLDQNGELIDPVKRAYHSLSAMGLAFQDYEIGGAMVRLQMLRNPSRDSRDLQQNILTQVTYVATLAQKNPHLGELMIPPSPADVEHMLLMSSIDIHDESDSIENLSADIASGNLKQLLQTVQIDQVKSTSYWAIPHRFFPSSFRTPAKILHSANHTPHVIIGAHENENGFLAAEKGNLYFLSPNGNKTPLSEDAALFSKEPILFKAALVPASTEKPPHHYRQLCFSLQGTLANIPLNGEAFLEGGLAITSVHGLIQQTSSQSVYLPKQFQDSGVLIGDKGYLSFAAQGASSVQEQRIPLIVAGFYDPGIMAIGNKCILAAPELVHALTISNQSFHIDPSFSSGLQIWIDDVSKAKQIKGNIEKAFVEAGIEKYWKVSSYHDYDFAKDILLQFQSDKMLFTLIGIIILGVACCNIISLLILLVNDKKKEIGILQAMGASSRSIALIFAICGAGMGVLSSLIGIGAAVLTLHNIDAIVHLLSSLQGHDMFNALFYGKSLPNALSADALRFILITTPLLSFLAGLVPAWKACRLRPSAILRTEI